MTDPERLDPSAPLLPTAGPEAASDAELIRRVRAGDSAAYEQLFVRHRDVAIRYARRIADSERADDLCAEAFAKILDLLQRGKGPDVAFRAYLLTTVRTSHLNTIRATSREELVADHEPIARMTPTIEDPDARFDASAICRAFRSLPERWQAALWLTSVEGLSNEEASQHLGVKVNAVASLSFRARAGLRQAYLSEHLLETTDPQCRRVVELLPAYLRDSVSARRRAVVESHLNGCASCTTAALELTEVNGRLGALLAPLALVGLGAAAVPVQTAGVVGVVGAAGAVKGAATGAVLQAKAAGSAISGLVSSKLAVAATVTAIGLAAGTEVLLHQGPDPRTRPPVTERAVVPPSPASVSPGPSVRPTARATPRPAPTQVLPPVTVEPRSEAPAAPAASVEPPVRTAPSPTATPSSGPTTTRMSVGQPTTETYTDWGARWDRVTVPVTDPTEDSGLVVTVTHTLASALATTTSTGWVCGTPVSDWTDGSLYATSRISCIYTGNGPAGPLLFEYRVVAGALLTATLTPPSAHRDSDLSDNVGTLLLR